MDNTTLFNDTQPLSPLKKEFIKLAIDHSVLSFGDFTLKSGRKSPYFFNMGMLSSGPALQTIGRCYAEQILEQDLSVQHLFGPAYKGIPLATATAIALAERGKDITLTFDRKEAKAHGEGGQRIGAPLSGKTVIIDDVITAGTAFRHSKSFIEREGGTVEAVVIALDRCERGASTQSTLSEIEAEGIKIFPIINFFDLIHYLKSINHTALDSMLAYKRGY